VDPQQVVNQVFDFAERMLAMQRDFTNSVLANSLALSNQITGPVSGDQDGQPAPEV
jgi:hypothetical protein